MDKQTFYEINSDIRHIDGSQWANPETANITVISYIDKNGIRRIRSLCNIIKDK